MKKQIRIVNFLKLNEDKFKKIREYRNQDYIRNVSFNTKEISEEEHNNYKKLLEQKDIYFAYLITCNEKDYGVISLKKINDDTYFIGDYLVDEIYQYEGGGIVNRICISYLSSKLGIKFLKSIQKKTNKRSNRAGGVKTVGIKSFDDNFNSILVSVDEFNSPETLNSKPRILFDKLYEIRDFIP